jgi:type VI protein secretion system component VasK
MLPALFLAQLEQGQLVDKASEASDRWLFLAAIVFIIIAFLTVIRYLVMDREKERDARINESAVHQEWVEKVYTENVKLTAQVLVVLQETNGLLKRLEERFKEK